MTKAIFTFVSVLGFTSIVFADESFHAKSAKIVASSIAELKLVRIAPGTFNMGSPESETNRSPSGDEKQHKVNITKVFYIGQTEVTQGQFKAVMGTNPSRFKEAGDTAPVEGVSWSEAISFCKALAKRDRKAGLLPAGWEYRLPTEAEWEYACRAGSQNEFYGPLDDVAWYIKTSGKTTHSVAKKEPNAWGLYDMLGNVSERCQDGARTYSGDSVTDPVGSPMWPQKPNTERTKYSKRVIRGGSWLNSIGACRVATRATLSLVSRKHWVGFRIVAAEADNQ